MIRSLLCAITCATVLTLTASPCFGQATKATKSAGKTAPANAIDLNTASQSELESVPGIGTPTAKKIIAGRPYSSVADLSKAGLSATSIKKIAPNVKVGNQPAASATATAQAPKASPAARQGSDSKPVPAAAAAPGGGPGMVWVNTETKVFHQPTDKWYGKTKKGKYMKESDAIAAGYHASKEK